MPPTQRNRQSAAVQAAPAGANEQSQATSTSPCLPPHRSASIGTLTARARALHAELVENSVRADAIQHRSATIRRELSEIDKQVREHAWDGQPLA